MPRVIVIDPGQTVHLRNPQAAAVVDTPTRRVQTGISPTARGPKGDKGDAGEQGPPGVGVPEVFVDDAPAVLRFVPLGDGTYGMEVDL